MEAHLVDLQAQLVSTLSSAKRARVHLQLGRHALQDDRLLVARRHLQEALVLDTSLDDAKRLLASLTVPVAPRPGLLQRLLGR